MTHQALYVGVFVNGLQVFTFEFKMSLAKQAMDDAIRQYKRDHDLHEKLFEFGRCVADFEVGED